jgi:hypothetical protein
MGLKVAVANGNWSNPATWNAGTLPQPGDVVASNGFTVTIDQNVNVDSITNAATNPVSAVPLMTGYTTPSGIVTFSSEFNTSYRAWQLFDRTITTSWFTGPSGTLTGWVAYEFTSPVVITSYVVDTDTSTYAAKNWTFEGWNGSSWVVLDTVTNNLGVVTRSFANTVAYIKYRINITANNGGTAYTSMRDLYLYGAGDSTTAAVAGGGFILNDGVTVTCTGTNGIINGNTTCITFSALGTYYINSRIVNNGSANCINITAAVTLYIVGEITNFSGNGFTTINAAAACVVYITGNVRGTGAPGGRCIVTSNGAEVRITGNVTTLGAGNANKAIIINNFSRVYIVGNVFYETTHSTNSDIISNSGYLNVVGTLNAFSTNGGFYVIQSTSGAAINIFTGPFISSPEGSQPLYVSRMHYQVTLGSYYEFRDNSTGGALPPAASAPAIRMNSPEVGSDLPVASNVRFGVVYGAGSLTGTMRVPAASNVRLGVAVDATVGTGAITVADIWNVLTSSLTTSGSIGERLKNVSTVQTTLQQLAAYNI